MAKSKNLFLSLLMAAFISGICLLSTQGCSSSINLKGKVCLQDELCKNKGNVLVRTVIDVLEGGRVLLGITGLPCAELDLKYNGGFEKGDILTFTTKDIGDGEICPVKVENYGTEPKDYPEQEILITTAQIKPIE